MSFIHANDAAMGNLGYERREADFYPTPDWVTEAVVPYLELNQSTPVWEPACGMGHMAEVLKNHFSAVAATDLHDYGYGKPGVDFLTTTVHAKGLVITNPPYGDLAEAFIRKALTVTAKHGGTVAMLLRNEYDSSKSRVDLFETMPFWRKVVLTSRPRWIEDSTGAPRHNYSWFIWDWVRAGQHGELLHHVRKGKQK